MRDSELRRHFFRAYRELVPALRQELTQRLDGSVRQMDASSRELESGEWERSRLLLEQARGETQRLLNDVPEVLTWIEPGSGDRERPLMRFVKSLARLFDAACTCQGVVGPSWLLKHSSGATLPGVAQRRAVVFLVQFLKSRVEQGSTQATFHCSVHRSDRCWCLEIESEPAALAELGLDDERLWHRQELTTRKGLVALRLTAD